MSIVRRVAVAAVAVALVPAFAGPAEASPPPETASVISDWNTVASATLLADTGKAPQEIFIYLAFMHAAMYDAVVGVHPRYEPYRRHTPAPRRASATAAAAAAGHKILETYSPYAQSALDDALTASLSTVPDGAAKTAGIDYGERVAQDLIDLRAHDGRYAPVQYTRPRPRACGGPPHPRTRRWPRRGSAG